jgi:drug/metabolite transporter (DMT)-like permease
MHTSNTLRGLSLFMAGLVLFACMDTTIKYLTASYPVPLIAAVRYAVNLVLMTALLAPFHGREIARTQRTGLVIVRACVLALGTLAASFALQRMPVAETISIIFVAPIVVILASGPLLGERVSRSGYVAAATGFAGILLIARPGSGLDPVGVACALVAMATTSAYQLLSRVLTASESTTALLFYSALVGTILYGIAAPWFVGGPQPGLFDTMLLISVGAYGGLGHFLFTAAYRHAPASILAPANYAQLLWSALLGWLVFSHVPDQWALTGMAVIAGSGVIAALGTRRPPVKRSV